MKRILTIALVTLFAACSNAPAATPLPTPDIPKIQTQAVSSAFATLTAVAPTATSTATRTSTPLPSDTPKPTQTPPPTNTPGPSVGKWDIHTSKSSFDDTTTVVLTLAANAQITGDLETYLPNLLIRCQEKKLDVFIVVGMQQDVEYGATDTSTVRVRFDSDPAQTMTMGHSTDGKALFFGEPIPMISALQSHKTMVFGFTPFNSSPVQTSFTLDGIDEALKPLRAACASQGL